MTSGHLLGARTITVITTADDKAPSEGTPIQAITTFYLDGSVVTRVSSPDVVKRHFEHVEARLQWLSDLQWWEEQAHYLKALALPGVAGGGWVSHAVLHETLFQVAIMLIGGGLGFAVPWAVRSLVRWKLQQLLSGLTAVNPHPR